MRTAILAALLCTATLTAQQDTIDVLDGETLYEGGWLLTLGVEFERAGTLQTGTDTATLPYSGKQTGLQTTFAAHYGLRHDLQLGFAVPWVDNERTFSGSQAPSDQHASGFGDLAVFGKWRFYRWDAKHKALNVAVIGGLTLPTGDDDVTDGGVRLEPELQPGSGSVDPSIGFGATYEPYRWRFNVAGLYQWGLDTDGDDSSQGDSIFGELAIGNRFWLEPYPGPFMRFDALLRYYEDAHAELDGQLLGDTGGQRLAAGVVLAFRPRPSIDLQAGFELPVWQDVNGTQFAEDWSFQFTVGYRF